MTSLLVAARAVSPASRRLPASRNSLDPLEYRLSRDPHAGHRSAMLHSPRRPSNTMRIFSSEGILLAGHPADVLDKPLRRRFSGSGFLSHLHSLAVTMSQKSSVQYSIPAICLIGADGDRGRAQRKSGRARTIRISNGFGGRKTPRPGIVINICTRVLADYVRVIAEFISGAGFVRGLGWVGTHHRRPPRGRPWLTHAVDGYCFRRRRTPLFRDQCRARAGWWVRDCLKLKRSRIPRSAVLVTPLVKSGYGRKG